MLTTVLAFSSMAVLREEMGITGRSGFHNLPEEARAECQWRVAELEERWPPADVQDFVDHIDHAVELIGIDHVGFSSDFDGGGGIVGWSDASESQNVTVELVRLSYTEEEIAKLWGGICCLYSGKWSEWRRSCRGSSLSGPDLADCPDHS